MQQHTQEIAQRVVDNRQEIAKAYKRRVVDVDQSALSALTWTLAGRQADAALLTDALDFIKAQSKSFSPERDNEQALANYLAMSDDKEAYLAKVHAIFAQVMEGKKITSKSRFSEAMIIANNADSIEEALQIAEQTEQLYERMREVHPLLVDDRDRCFVTLLTLSDRDTEAMLADAEECYQLLGKGYKLTEGRQVMANILSLSPKPPAEKVERVRELREAFKANKVSLGWATSVEFAVLAVLAEDSRPAAEIGADVAEIVAFIKKHKGFKGFSLIGGLSRVVIASMISTYANSLDGSAESVNSALSLAIVQSILDWCMYIIIINATII